MGAGGRARNPGVVSLKFVDKITVGHGRFRDPERSEGARAVLRVLMREGRVVEERKTLVSFGD